MTSPGGDVPEGAYVGTAGQSNSITDLNNLTEDEAKRRMQGQIAPSFNAQRDGVWQNGGLLGAIANLFFGPGAANPVARISDGMTALNSHLELLDDVPGYAGAVMLQNHRFTGSGLRTIPFNKEYGPSKNAHLNVSNHRMILTEGSWSCHFTVSTGTGTALGMGHRIRATVRDKNGSTQIEREFTYQQPGGATWEQHYAMPIIIPPASAPWSVELSYTHSGSWWTVLGGTGRTLMWVERKNIDVANWVPFEATDGPDIE